MKIDIQQWVYAHAPWPFWAFCFPLTAPICWLDDIAHAWFPQTFGWSTTKEPYLECWPVHKPLICRWHDRAGDWAARRKYPEDFDN